MKRFILAACLFAAPVGAATVDMQPPARGDVAGVALVVADAKGVVRVTARGLAVADPARARPMGADTPVRVASVSKLVVAIGVMRLVEAGKLDLDSDVSRWLGWPLRNPAFPDAPVTLRQLLSHTSGVVDGPGYSFPLEASLRGSLTAAHWSGSVPGGRFAYANLNYGIIGTVMEAATGERFDRLMSAQVLAPLRLDAGYNWSGASDAAVAAAGVLYRSGKDESDWHPDGDFVAQIDDIQGVRPDCPVRSEAGCDLADYVPGSNGTMFSPQGGLRISALGLAKIGRMLLGQGRVDGVRLLTPASVRMLMTPVWRASGRPQDDTYQGQMLCYGAGLQCLSGQPGASDQMVPGAPQAWWGHLGEAYGLLGGLWVDKSKQRVLVYLMTGTRADPFAAPHRSAFSAIEEQLLIELAATPARR
ncbi:MAG: serine hydrolase domain-containing protein [Polymorphobacter sp.]